MANIATSKSTTEFERYGLMWDSRFHNDLFIELFAYLNHPSEEGQGGRLTRLEHYWKAVDILWNNNPRSPRKVVRNDWTNDMSDGMIYNRYCALAGSGSSGKSDSMAVYGIVNYLASPLNTKVLLTSTTLTAAKLRVWKSVSELWLKEFPGKMVQSNCLIKGYNKVSLLSEETGIKLIPAAGSSSTEIDQGFIGIKQDRVIALLDELSEIPMGVLNACYSNLETNPHFELKAASNPNLYTDPFGVFAEPRDGWNSVSDKDYKWKTSRGVCLRFDAEQSPNIKAGRRLFPWLPSQEAIDMAKHDYGENSRFFYRMFKAFWFAGASEETVYTEGELVQARAHVAIDPEEFGGKDRHAVAVAGGDPAYTQGGDRFPVVYGEVVQLNGKSVLEVQGYEILKDDISNEGAGRSYNSVKLMQELCVNRGISPDNFGYDMTGAGIPFRDIVVSQWSSLPMGINFGGSPSKLQISPVDKRKANDVYANRVTEIWVRMKGLIREKRLRGLPADIVKEICERRWHKAMLTSSRKLKIESKVDMKARGLKSPDLADALFVLCEVAIRNGLMGEMETIEVDKRSKDGWADAAQFNDVLDASDIGLEY